MTDRNPIFDVFKGIGIILMVIGHTIAPCWKFIYMFHMAIFFICSGIFFKEKHYENKTSILKFFKSKVKGLYVPFVLWNGLLVLLHNFLIKINIYTSNPDFLSLTIGSSFGLKENYSLSQMLVKLLWTLLFSHGEQLGGATWFLRVLFYISIASLLGHFLLKKIIKNNSIFNIIRCFIYCFSLLAGFYCYKIGFRFYSIGVMLSCSNLYYLGILYNKYKENIDIKILGFICSLSVLCFAYPHVAGKISLGENYYPNPLWLITVSVAGFIFIMSISNLLVKFNITKAIFAYIGRHTISILLFHFTAFKVINYIQTVIYSKPTYCIAAFPVYINTEYWWIIYTVTGVALPIFAVFLWENIKNYIRHN